MQRSILLRVKSYDLGTDCLIHGKPSWMMPDYVAFSTRVLFDLGWRRDYIREDQALPDVTPAPNTESYCCCMCAAKIKVCLCSSDN